MLIKFKNQKGVSLFLALMIMTVFSAMGLGLSVILMSQREVIRGINYSVNAVCAADAGVEAILYLDKRCGDGSNFCSTFPNVCNNLCTGLESPYTTTSFLSNGAGYTATSSNNCGITSIKSTGDYKEVKRAFELNFGYSLEEVYLNEGTSKNCDSFCEYYYNCDCEIGGVGTDLPPTNDKYRTVAGGCQEMDALGCGGQTMFPEGEECPPGSGNESKWTYCSCVPE